LSEIAAVKTEELLTRITNGDDRALGQLLARYRNYVRRIVDARLDYDLRTRVDPSDIVQESLTVASRRIDDYLERRPTSFRIWLRRKVLEQIVDTRRRHYALKRDVRREHQFGNPSSLSIAGAFFGDKISEIANQQEMLEKIQTTIEKLSDNDREILLLRHSEGLSNEEAAEVLDTDPNTASQRYGRAVRRLSKDLNRQGFKTQ
jgi:RNA polymerase sigma-70 factor (ECF subfamily)